MATSSPVLVLFELGTWLGSRKRVQGCFCVIMTYTKTTTVMTVIMTYDKMIELMNHLFEGKRVYFGSEFRLQLIMIEISW